jgi:uncharacterized protein YbaA (DUF1428 family)
VIIGVLALVAVSFVRGSAGAARRKVEAAEVAREQGYIRVVNAWLQDTTATAPPSESANRPVPTSARAKRMWVISRMLVDRSLWEREIMERHGVKGHRSPAAWDSARYQASARNYPQVGRYVEGRVAAVAEIQKTAAAWMEERVAALAREAGMTPQEIRELFPSDFAGVTAEEARLAEVMLQVHRHYVEMDPRVRPAGGEQLLYQREDDIRRSHEIVAKMQEANAAANQARQRRFANERAAFARVME